MKIDGKKQTDGSIELSVHLTKEEASTVHESGIFGSKSEYCVTCTKSTGPVGPQKRLKPMVTFMLTR